MKKGLVLGIVLVSILLIMPLVFGEMSGEITGECTYYDRGIEYERCCPMGDKINCVKCRDTDGGRDYYTKGETMESHWNYFERGALASGTMPIVDECIGNITYRENEDGTITKEVYDGNRTYRYRFNADTIAGGHGAVYEGDLLQIEKVNVLKEGYCEWVGEYQKYTFEEYECPNGCENGACIREDTCPTLIGWRIEGIKCFVDSGCNYDSTYDYYDSAEDCIDGLGKVEYPVLEPLPVPDICSDLLIEENIGTYNYRETTYSRMGPDVYSKDGRKIGASQCCLADYKKNLLDLTGSVAYICPLDNRANVENTIAHVAREDMHELGEYVTQKVYWMRSNGNEAILWTSNINILAVADESGTIPDDIAQAYLNKHNSDLGIVDIENITITPEASEESESTEPEVIEEPINIPENKLFYSCTGCEFQGKCYPVGYREGKQYCDINSNGFIDQSRTGTCDNSFECKSNVCVNSECASEGLMKKIANWFKKVFGGESE